MNAIFAEHVTQTAFFLSVSKKQIAYLEHLLRHPWSPTSGEYYDHRPMQIGKPDNWIASFGSLARKGLVFWVVHETRQKASGEPVELGHWELTEAGRLTCSLLVEAGLLSRIALKAVA